MSRSKTRAPKGVGRPTTLNDRERIDRFLDLIRQGNHARVACAATGIGNSTLYGWLSQGEDARAAILEAQAQADAEGVSQPRPASIVSPYALRCLEFSDQFARARADAEVHIVAVIGKVITGGHLISRKPALTGEGTPIYDEEGCLVYEEVYAQPDGKLGLEVLSRTAPDRWGRNGALQVEVSGPEGGPVQVESGTVVKALSERLASTLALPAGETSGEAVEYAEVVEDDESGVSQ